MINLDKLYSLLYRHFGALRWWPAETSFEVIIGAILTQNTNWHNVEQAIINLKEARLLEMKNLLKAKTRDLEAAIRPSGFYKQKTKRLQDFVSYLYNEYHGDLDSFFNREVYPLRQELLAQSGIGPETADSILLYAGQKKIFVIDAYTRRILVRINSLEYNNYAEYQDYFQQNIPASVRRYNQFHALLVELAKQYCRKKPQCQQCPVKRECDYNSHQLTLPKVEKYQ